MKKSMKISVIILTLFFGYSLVGFGQDEVRINKSKRLTFEGESQKAEIKVISSSEYNVLQLNIACQLSKGEIKVEIVDPLGNNRGNFTVKSEDQIVKGNNTIAESQVSGQMAKAFSKPILGDWIVRAIPSSAVGTMNLNIAQAFEPKVDLIGIQSEKKK